MPVPKIMIEIKGPGKDDRPLKEDSFGAAFRTSMVVRPIQIKDEAPESFRDSDLAVFTTQDEKKLTLILGEQTARDLISQTSKALLFLYEEGRRENNKEVE